MSDPEDTNPPCYAVFNGYGGWPAENRRANETFIVGHEYRITGGSIKKWSTSLTIEGFEGEWNSVLFDYDKETAPVIPWRQAGGYEP
jgi:hypothetical protein